MIIVCGQKVALGRAYQHQTLTIWVSETTLAIELPDRDTKIVRRTTTQPARSIKGPAAADRNLSFLAHMSHISWRTCAADLLSDHSVATGVATGVLVPVES